jgi:S-DNA-T family DNA segregation ATPase FtsK/SpoIIIE
MGVLGLIGGGLMVVGYGGALIVHQTMPETVMRRKLKRLFRDGGLYIKKKQRRGKDKEEVLIFPRILKVTATTDYMQVNFRIPNGMEPKEVFEKEWLFKQGFGQFIDLQSEDGSYFELIVYPADMKQFDYDVKDVLPALKDKEGNDMGLPIMAGKSRKGWESYDMVTFPHILISGVTGSGKSVALRSILTTILLKKGQGIKLICADLKRSEFHLFRGIAEKVIVDPADLETELRKIKAEMTKRGNMLDKARKDHIDKLPNPPKYIILAIDEVSLLRKNKPVMEMVEDISSLGRALGIFLILSMQRPDSKILDGALKNNLNVRMAFRQSDDTNSRIALGSGEAADIRLSQRGRMYMKDEELKMIQMPYLELEEAEKLLEPLFKEKQKTPPPPPRRADSIDAEFTVIEDDEESDEEGEENEGFWG